MIIFKPTQLTLKDLHVKPEAVAESDPFFSWHVNFFTLYGKKHYVFVNDLSILSLTVSGIRTNSANKLLSIFKENLEAYMVVEDIPQEWAQYYLDQCNERVISKTDSRSIVSTMTDLMFIMKAIAPEDNGFRDKDVRHKANNRSIYKPIDYQEPIRVFVKELQQRFEAVK
ncbi:DUF6933 domain-containing protein [Paenibacillus silvae]|uniref:DUF6933 domain-containing protein n=1 Tax=Paenibacillus silvae TaxID=1325358 RepID=A0ABQ1ZCX0_9BACL|nr:MULTISPECIES: hypothetical protein [Paenibacillus]MCK6074677.1 hypothetical protein [Paenibacillus silvae]MCK6147848.1 hypothetical protein [Paenibacillus silvae]MCK6266146.1 hypothetical protein [Paenibacillus silvae]GGH55192.1 hypothetical protein GCM10008014_24610 [Paenibacillus silvae]